MGENWKRALRILWYLLGPLLLYALVNDAVILCWRQLGESNAVHLSKVPESIPAAAAGAAVLWLWYRKERKGQQIKWGTVRWLWLIAAAAASCVFFNHVFMFLGISSDGYDKVKYLVFDLDPVWQIAGAGFLVPLAEELVFRGLGYQRLRREVDALPAAVITALFFDLYHGNLIQGIYAFFIGLLLALVWEAYDNLAASWLFHAAANLTAILLTGSSVLMWPYANKAVMLAVTVIGGMILFGFVVNIREDIK